MVGIRMQWVSEIWRGERIISVNLARVNQTANSCSLSGVQRNEAPILADIVGLNWLISFDLF